MATVLHKEDERSSLSAGAAALVVEDGVDRDLFPPKDKQFLTAELSRQVMSVAGTTWQRFCSYDCKWLYDDPYTYALDQSKSAKS